MPKTSLLRSPSPQPTMKRYIATAVPTPKPVPMTNPRAESVPEYARHPRRSMPIRSVAAIANAECAFLADTFASYSPLSVLSFGGASGKL